jgi:hypothetical protein
MFSVIITDQVRRDASATSPTHLTRVLHNRYLLGVCQKQEQYPTATVQMCITCKFLRNYIRKNSKYISQNVKKEHSYSVLCYFEAFAELYSSFVKKMLTYAKIWTAGSVV